MAQATSLAQVDTEYSADCIEWCPHAPFQDLFICGTYQVVEPTSGPPPPASAEEDDDEEAGGEVAERREKKQTQRKGRLLLFRVRENQSSFEEVQRIETAAILDAKWSPYLAEDGSPTLAIADAKGHIILYVLDPSSSTLREVQTLQVDDESTLCLSLDFSDRLNPTSPPRILTSLSTGDLALLSPSPSPSSTSTSTQYTLTQKWRAHEYEPWTCCFDLTQPHLVWSGGDDLTLKQWDLGDTSRPVFVNKRFDAGITTLTCSPHTPHLLAVGSYDQYLRIYDVRSPRTLLFSIDLGGGIWRTRFHPDATTRGADLLVACMHDGFKVVRLGGDAEEEGRGTGCEVVRRFDAHGSLTYGADWSRLPPRTEGKGSLVATCSFYDHTMHLWRA